CPSATAPKTRTKAESASLPVTGNRRRGFVRAAPRLRMTTRHEAVFRQFPAASQVRVRQSHTLGAGGKEQESQREENDSSLDCAKRRANSTSSVDAILANNSQEALKKRIRAVSAGPREPAEELGCVGSNSTGPSEAGGSSSAVPPAAEIKAASGGRSPELQALARVPSRASCTPARIRTARCRSTAPKSRRRSALTSEPIRKESQARSRRLSGPNLPMPARLAAPSAVGAVAGSNSGAPRSGLLPGVGARLVWAAATLTTKDVQKSDCFSANLEEIQLELALGQPSQSAPLWDSDRQKFVGILTVTDFIYILQQVLQPDVVNKHRTQTPLALARSALVPMESCFTRESTACRYDPLHGNALYIVTHNEKNSSPVRPTQLPMPGWLGPTAIIQLGIGTHSKLSRSAGPLSLVKVLSLFVQNRVSALPVLSSDAPPHRYLLQSS
uniref:CBS domain-containing protein n=1 Tax=Macrostomum lignano TaxID=282301 RepID=A0A1I8F726_9PLAT